MRDSQEEIVITALGLVGCLAADAVNACAAARAGLSGASELPFQVMDEETGVPVGVVGFAMTGLTDGFEGAGRVARILQLALADFRRALPVPDPTVGGRCSWLVALPDRLLGAESDAAGSSDARQRAVDVPGHVRHLVQIALSGTGFDVAGPRLVVRLGGHETFGLVLEEAVRQLDAREAEWCVVGGADSLVDPDVLQALLEQGRLKTPNEPVGVSPGEGGALFLVEKRETAQRRGAPVLGIVSGVATGMDEDRLADRAPGGRALAQLATSITSLSDESGPPLLISDYNGEAQRSAEYGHALFRLGALNQVFQQAQTWFPATSFGDTGAASAAIGLAMLLRGFSRDYAGARDALLLSSADSELRSVLAVRAPSI